MPDYRNMTAKEAIRAAYYDRAFPDCCQSVYERGSQLPATRLGLSVSVRAGRLAFRQTKRDLSLRKGPFWGLPRRYASIPAASYSPSERVGWAWMVS